MSVMKIPDSVLPKLRCRCGAYLSKPPIGIHDGRMVCPDCVNLQPPGTSSSCAPFEALAELFAFPCRYAPQGCQQYAKFDEVNHHESICTYRSYHCPASLHSFCDWSGPLTKIHEHYEKQHPTLSIQSPSFPIRVDENYEVYRLTMVGEVLVLLQVKCVVEQDLLCFSMVCFCSSDCASFINYHIKLTTTKRSLILEQAQPKPDTKIKMVPNESLKISISSVICVLQDPLIDCHWTIDVPEELQARIKSQEKPETFYELPSDAFKCSTCKISVVPPIFRCDQNHVTCLDCKGYYNQCGVCRKKNVDFKIATDLGQVAKSTSYNCRWVLCGPTTLPWTQIRQHEQICAHRIYKCPKCLNWSGLFPEIEDHFKSMHPRTTIFFANPVTVVLGRGTSSGYIFTFGEFFQFDINHMVSNSSPTNMFTVDMFYLGPPSYANYWDFRVMRQPGNVPCCLSKKGENWYTVDVAPSFSQSSVTGSNAFFSRVLNARTQCTLTVGRRNYVQGYWEKINSQKC